MASDPHITRGTHRALRANRAWGCFFLLGGIYGLLMCAVLSAAFLTDPHAPSSVPYLLAVIPVLFAVMAARGVSRLRQAALFRQYAAVLSRDPARSLDNLATARGEAPAKVIQNVHRMLRRGYFPKGRLNGSLLILPDWSGVQQAASYQMIPAIPTATCASCGALNAFVQECEYCGSPLKRKRRMDMATDSKKARSALRRQSMRGSLMFFGGLAGTILFFVIIGSSAASSAEMPMILCAYAWLFSVILMVRGILRRKQIRLFKEYAAYLSKDPTRSLEGLANSRLEPVSAVLRNLRSMLKGGFFPGAILNGNTLVFPGDELRPILTSRPTEQQAGPSMVTCSSCGAINAVAAGAIRECEYCGAPLGK